MKAVTLATKEIEAKISSDVWNRQKVWEMKREVLFSAAKSVAAIDDALLALGSVYAHGQQVEDGAWEAKLKSSERWLVSCTKFDEARLLVAIVCNKEAKEALDSLARVTSAMSQNITKGEWETYDALQKDLARKLFAAREAMRKELDIDKSS